MSHKTIIWLRNDFRLNDNAAINEAAQNNDEIILNGDILINFIEENAFQIDSIIIQIRLYTALSYSNIGDYSYALELNQRTLHLIEVNWKNKMHQFLMLLQEPTTHDQRNKLSKIRRKNLYNLRFFSFRLTPMLSLFQK